MKKSLLFICTIFCFVNYAQVLDTSFGLNGIVNNQFSTSRSSDVIGAATLQPDGKIIYVGKGNYDNYSFITRHNSDGTIDLSFNNYGFKIISGEGSDCVALQSDGKILMGNQNSIYRFNSDGSFDSNFGVNGFVSLSNNPSVFYSKSIVLQSDGKIVVTGTDYNETNNNFEVIRLNSNGSFDTGFDNDGKAIIAISSINDEAYASVIQADGKIIITGQTRNGSNTSGNYDIATARLNSNGTLDTTFGANGFTIFQNTSLSSEYGRSITLQSDNKILIGGSSASKIIVLRYNSIGALDTTFDGDGFFLTTANTNNSIAINYCASRQIIKSLVDGKIIIGGSLLSNYGIVKLNSNGTLDTSFGTNGIVTNDKNAFDRVTFLLMNPNGNLIIGGGSSTNTATNFTSEKIEFTSNGIFVSDLTFSLNQGSNKIISSIVQQDGKIVSIGENQTSGFKNSLLIRQNSNGSLDTSFGINGIITFDSELTKVIQLSNGKYIVLSSFDRKLYKYNIDGTPDSSFGTNGLVDYNLSAPNIVMYLDDVVASENDQIFIGYDYNINGTGETVDFGLSKLNNNGSIDTSFGTNGVATTRFNFYGLASSEWPANIILQSDNKIIVSGILNSFNTLIDNSSIGITRFNINGTLDNSFGISGKVVTQINSKNYPYQTIALNDDKFLLNTQDVINNETKTSTIKYNVNGSVDTSFGTNGIVTDSNKNNSMILQPDGKFLKSGSASNQFSINRYLSNGTIDTTFGNNGTLSTSINYLSDVNSLVLTQDNKLLAGGYSFNGTNVVMTQAQYTDLNLGALSFNTQNSILIYPNPIQSEATFTYNLVNDETVSIDIIDLQGKIVQSILQNKFQIEGSYNQTITLSNTLAAGNYILKFSSSTGSQSVKIIKKD
ncbi:T9SS type A sorting domain-containing protein [Flavobacterium sp.]|uniref:T9SS type A sorting domain-containing protein n=1 Tax=Flavobacterium sp. TaxID=239 RepID=UPI003752D5C5